jgi:hypothetical protein
MAGRLRIRMVPFGSPGDIELAYATKVGGLEATLANYVTKSVAVAKEDGNNMLECELAANTEYPGSEGAVKVGATTAQKYLLNITQVQQITEF